MRASGVFRKEGRSPTVAVWTLCCTLVLLILAGDTTSAQSLRGSPASLDRQNHQAARHDFTFLRESAQLRRFVQAGLLVPVSGGRDYSLAAVSFPYARPEVKLFIERLSQQYRSACGEELVVTSLTRPVTHQPRNASPRSVHPTGMALDLRRPRNRACRGWLERTLLYLEEKDVLEATRERGPPHYHVAVFPNAYARYVSNMVSRPSNDTPSIAQHTVRWRDTLWDIARHYGTTLTEIRHVNGLRSSVIHPGQVLQIPVTTDAN